MAGYSDDMLALRTSYEGKLHDLRAANSELAARATQAEAALAAMTKERDEALKANEYLLNQFEPYRQEGQFGGMCKQPELAADADEADRLAHKLCDAVSGLFVGLSADHRSRTERYLAGYIRAALSASLERERVMREALEKAESLLRTGRKVAPDFAEDGDRLDLGYDYAMDVYDTVSAALQLKEPAHDR